MLNLNVSFPIHFVLLKGPDDVLLARYATLSSPTLPT